MRIFVALMLSLCASTAYARDFHQLTLPNGKPLTVADVVPKVMAMQTAARASAVIPRPDIIYLDTAGRAFIIPISGNTAGSFGTYFRSDVTIANLRNAQQFIAATYFQQGQDNSSAPIVGTTFGPGEIDTIPDFVGTVIQKGGIGTLFIYASDTQGNPDSNGQIDGFSRIWTPQPNSTGEVSQNFDAIDPGDITGNGFTYILGLRQDSRFRSNIGIVNFSGAAHSWTVTSLSTGVTSTINVPPYSVIQTGVAAGSASSNGFVQLGLATNSNDTWSAYGTTNDNTTGDGWVSRAKRFVP